MLRRYVMDVGRVTVRISSQYTFPLRLAEKQTFDMGRGESVSDKNKGSFSSLCLQRQAVVPLSAYRGQAVTPCLIKRAEKLNPNGFQNSQPVWSDL